MTCCTRCSIHALSTGNTSLIKLNGRLKAGGILLLLFIIVGVILPRFSPYDPRSWNAVPRNLQPSLAHLLGTTSLGQDTFWLLTFAVQNSLFIGVVVAFFATAVGVLAGLIGGFVGGPIDRGLTLLMDVFISVPSLPILILVASLLHGKTSLLTISLVLIVFNWPWPARQVRSIALSMREKRIHQHRALFWSRHAVHHTPRDFPLRSDLVARKLR